MEHAGYASGLPRERREAACRAGDDTGDLGSCPMAAVEIASVPVSMMEFWIDPGGDRQVWGLRSGVWGGRRH